MAYNIKTTDLEERAVTNASELLSMKEPPQMNTYLWCKIQAMAESLITQHEEKLRIRKETINLEIYRSILNKRKFDRRIIRMLLS